MSLQRTFHFISTAPAVRPSLPVPCSSHLHLSLSLSPCFSPSPFLPAEGPTAWMRCWVHGNWVSIDWTAAWPMGAREWEQQHRLRLSYHILQENIHAAQRKVQQKNKQKKNKIRTLWGLLVFFFSFGKCKHTLAHFVLCCLLRWEAFLQHWLDHLSDWVHHLSRPDCHISLWCCLWRLSCHVSVLGERGTDVEIFAKEEAVIALSACRHCAHTQLSYAPSPATLPTERYFKIKESVVRLSWGAASLSLRVRMYL